MNSAIKNQIHSLPFPEWPAEDQTAWQAALAEPDLFDHEISVATRWRPTTRNLIQVVYGYWLHWLIRSDQLDLSETPAERASRARIIAFHEMMKEHGLASHTIAGRLQQLGNALKAIAPGQDWGWLLRSSYRLQAQSKPKNDKDKCMVPAADVYQLGIDLMNAAEKDRFRTDTDRAVLFRDGLMIAFLMLRVPRRANLTAITMGDQLRKRDGKWFLEFSCLEMKNDTPFEFSWPPDLETRLEKYIEIYRKTLLNTSRKNLPSSDALWISKQGTQMTSAAVYYQITDRTGSEFGEPINPHAFRRIYATDAVTLDSDHATDIQRGLGHNSMKTSEKYYNMAKMSAAGDLYQITIDDLRRQFDPAYK